MSDSSPSPNDDRKGKSLSFPGLPEVEVDDSHVVSSSPSEHIRLPSPASSIGKLRPANAPRSQSNRSIREVMRMARENEEQELLIGEDQMADDDGCYPPRQNDDPQAPNPHANLPIYTTIHRIRRLIIATIDDPYDIAQLKSPRMNTTVVRPLVEHLYDPNDVSIVYCLLVNRVHFLREQTYQSHHQSVNMTRASLCELVAARVLRRYDEFFIGKEGLLLLANVLVAGFEPFQKAPIEVTSTRLGAQRPNGAMPPKPRDRLLTALEVAIVSESKLFLSSTTCQKVVDAVWRGRITYTPMAWLDIVPDRYKRRAISIYDPRRAPILNQYRLIVPRTRNIIETSHFAVLFVLYVWAMYTKSRRMGPSHLDYTNQELIFSIYALGWTLDELTSVLEHGWSVHTENLWSFLDLTFVVIYVAYFGMRLHALSTGLPSDAKQALDVLALAAPVLLPRLAFCLMNESMLFIALRAMMADFFLLSLLAAWLFGGFLLALRWLSQSQTGITPHSAVTIAEWLLMVWFGLDGTGLQKSGDLHSYIGPALMVLFAMLGNTLFLTILVATLSDTYSQLAKSATAEIQFRRAVLTFEGVKSDALFSYPPPFNALFLFVLLPLKWATTPRWFHKINVTFIRVLNAPILLAICLWERQYLWRRNMHDPLARARASGGFGRNYIWRAGDFWGSFGAHADLHLVFDDEPPEHVIDDIDNLDADFTDELWWDHRGYGRANSIDAGMAWPPSKGPNKRSSRQFSDGGSIFSTAGQSAYARPAGQMRARSNNGRGTGND